MRLYLTQTSHFETTLMNLSQVRLTQVYVILRVPGVDRRRTRRGIDTCTSGAKYSLLVVMKLRPTAKHVWTNLQPVLAEAGRRRSVWKSSQHYGTLPDACHNRRTTCLLKTFMDAGAPFVPKSSELPSCATICFVSYSGAHGSFVGRPVLCHPQ